jgi:PAS domain S-box-containing protein
VDRRFLAQPGLVINMSSTTRAATPTDRRLRRYIAGWSVAALVGMILSVRYGTATPAPSAGLIAALVAVTVLSEAVSTGLRVRGSKSPGMSLSLLEFAVAAVFLLLPSAFAVPVIVGGVLITHLFRMPAPQKLLFNISQHAVAASISAGIMSLVPLSADVLSAPRAAAVTIAVLAYSGTNSIALARLFVILEMPQMREQLTDRPGFVLATAFGSASVGIIGATLWTSHPSLTVTVLGPALALYLAYGSSFRMKALLSEVSSERDHLDRVVSGVDEGIVLLDDRGVVRLWNPAMARITGVAEDDAIGKPATDLIAGTADDGSFVDPLHALRGHLDASAYTVRLTDASGQPVDTRISHTLVRDERERCIGDVVLVRDLSREREAHALKEDFVARVSHELRTPLSPLRGYAQILLDAGDRVTPEKRTMMLQTMVERVGHLERLIEDLLLVSKVASGALSPADEVTAEAADVAAVVARTSEWVDRDHPEREVRVRVDGDGHVAWADSLRVGQIVTNLVKNACKYATPGTPVDVTVSRSGEEVRVDVTDHGPGVPEDKLEAIFDRFHRLEDPQRMRTSGLGLGLYIARRLATAMGGELTVTSKRGSGSTFSLTLPAATAEQVSAGSSAAAMPPSSRVHRREALAER